jgi:hypothetical protein
MMMLTFDTSTPWLEIPEAVHTEAWQQSQTVSMPGSHWQAYLNQICLKTILPWLQEKFDRPPIVSSPEMPEFWELVNGSAVILGDTRLIIIPTEAMDKSEMRVPQEWIDIPGWVGDYYLAVEVDTDEQVLQVWGYSTHEQIKSQGNYDAIDRTYSLDGSEFIQDLAVFWVMQQFPAEPTRAEVSVLPNLSTTEAETLIQQLGRSDLVLPRLQIPFQQWGALLQNDRWLQRLWQQRSTQNQQPEAGQNQAVVRLSQWLQNRFETGWQAIAELFSAEPDLAFSFRREDDFQNLIRRVKQIQLGVELPDVVLAIALEAEPDGRSRIGVQVLPSEGNVYLPAHLRLVMRSTDGDIVQSVEAGSQSRYVQLRRFKGSPGMAFRLQITVADVSVTEDFVV